MYTHFEGDGRQVVVAAQAQARRLGHDFIGCEHLLYGLACDEGRVGALLRQHGAAPEQCEAEFVRLVGTRDRTRSRSSKQARPDSRPGARSDSGPDAANAPGNDPLDGAALGFLGIDLDAVRDRVEAVFGPGALTAAAVRPHRARRLGWARLRRPSGNWPGRASGERPGRRAGSRSGLRMQSPRESWSAAASRSSADPLRPADPRPGHLPLTRRAEACLKRSLARAGSARTGLLGAEEIALELLARNGEIPARVLAGLGIDAARLRAEILSA